MKKEKEITVRVNSDYQTLHNELLEKGFKIVEEYQVNDIYLLPNNIDINSLNTLDILKNCVLLRDIVGIVKRLVYKYKKYDNDKNIIEQAKIQCGIDNIDDALAFMKSINFKELLSINDRCIVYTNSEIALVVEIVNDEYLFIEMEEENEHIARKYNDIEKMKQDFKSVGLNCDYSNYFVRKAEIIFNENFRK